MGQRQIITELRQVGFSVADVSQGGCDDFPDLVIGRQGITALVELKTRRYKSSRSGLTARDQLSDGQSKFAASWKGSPVIVAYHAIDVIMEFGKLLRARSD